MYAHSNSLIFCKSGSQICSQMFVSSVGIKTRASLRILQVSLASSDRPIQRYNCITVFLQTIIPVLPFKVLLQYFPRVQKGWITQVFSPNKIHFL